MAKRRANGEGSIRKQKNTRQIIFSARNFAMDQCLLPAGPSAPDSALHRLHRVLE